MVTTPLQAQPAPPMSVAIAVPMGRGAQADVWRKANSPLGGRGRLLGDPERLLYEAQEQRASGVAQWVKLLPVYHTGASSSPGCSTSDPVPHQCPGRTMEGGPDARAPVTLAGGRLHSWFMLFGE